MVSGDERRGMMRNLEGIASVLSRIERLAEDLHGDTDGHVRRSAGELRAAFEVHGTMETAVARVRESVRMLRRGHEEGTRREFVRRSHGLDHLQDVIELELLPSLRRIGFDV